MTISTGRWNRRSFLKTVAQGAVVAGFSAGTPAVVRGADPIVIGCQADLTGTFASWYYWIEKGARAAAERINKEGGINGRPVRYVVEDSESNPATGSRKMRRLVQRENTDFVVGSVHSGVNLASAPVAMELKTPYFPIAMAAEITAERGNRYVFRVGSHVRTQVRASAKFAVENIAKKWSIVVTDFAWGWSHRDWFKKEVEEFGGTVLDAIAIPVGTKDFIPFLSKVPRDTEGIYWVFPGGDTLGYILAIHELGYRGKKLSPICAIEAVDTERVAEQLEGAWCVEYLPRQLKHKDTSHNRDLRKAVGVDDHGREVGNPSRTIAGSHYWMAYESVMVIKRGVEMTRWKTRKDHPAFIEALEGLRVKESSHFPQGDLFIRAEDHQGFHQHWMSQVIKGKVEVKFALPVERVIYPAPVDYRKQKA